MVTDICARNGKTKVIWIENKTQALTYKPAPNEILLTVHRWFAPKECPGDYLFGRHAKIAATVNARLNKTEEEEEMTQEQFNQMMNNYLAELAKQPATWEQDACNWARQIGLMVGDATGNQMPKKFCTRGEMAVMLKRLAEELQK